MNLLKEENHKIIIMVDGNEYFMSIRGNKIIASKENETENEVTLLITLVDIVSSDDFDNCIDFLSESCFKGKKVNKKEFNYSIMNSHGNKIAINKENETENEVFLSIRLVDLVLAEDFYKFIDSLSNICFRGKTVFIKEFNYPNHAQILLENGYQFLEGYYYKDIQNIKEKERG